MALFKRVRPRNGMEKAGLLPGLKRRAGSGGHLSREALAGAAADADLSLGTVFGIATFYSHLPMEPKGRNVIRICRCVPCDMKDAQGIVANIRKALGISPGETTPDGRFSVELVNCIGACDRAPAMLINDDLHGDLTPSRVSEILKSY